MVPLPGLPPTPGCSRQQAQQALRYLFFLRRADVRSRTSGYRGF